MATEFKQNSILNALLATAKVNPKILDTLSPEDRQALGEYDTAKMEAQATSAQEAATASALSSHKITKRSDLKTRKECVQFIRDYGSEAFLELRRDNT